MKIHYKGEVKIIQNGKIQNRQFWLSACGIYSNIFSTKIRENVNCVKCLQYLEMSDKLNNKDKYIAILEKHDYSERCYIEVPLGQSLDFDEGTAYRRWLHPHLGFDWHLSEFVKEKTD